MTVRCSYPGCNAILTSPRSVRLGIGQRCKWKRDGRLTRRRTTTQGQGMPINDVDFTKSGGTHYQRKLYEAIV